MVKCSSCNAQVEEIFLGKIKGAYIGPKGKRVAICSACQSREK